MSSVNEFNEATNDIEPKVETEKTSLKVPSNVNGCVKFSSETPSSHHHGHRDFHHVRIHHRSQSETSAVSNDASILSSSPTSSTCESGLESLPPDGGWGWVVVFASFMTNLIADGITYSFGVMFVDFIEYFGESKSKTAWIGSLFMGIPLLAGPIASTLTDRFGCQKVTIAGALLAALGFILSSFANSIELLFFTFGIMSGFGLALCYVAAIVIVAYYFDKRRSFATGISVCGSGVGTFIFAPLIQYLLDNYNWRGTTLILAGFFLNIIVCGALMRDLEWTKKKSKSEKSLKTSTESLSQKSQCTSEESKKLLQSGGQGGDKKNVSSDDLKDSERLCNSLVQLPTFIKHTENVPPDIMEMLSSNRVNYEFLLEHYPQLLTQSISEQANLKTLEEPSPTDISTHEENLHRGVNFDCSKSVSAQPQSKKENSLWNKRRTLPNRRLSTAYFQNLRFHRHSITYRGAMLNIHRYHLRASSCPDIYRNSMITIAQEEDDAICSFMEDVKEAIIDMCDISYFKNLTFLIFCISNLLLYVWYDVPYIYIADSAIHKGINEDNASYLISIIGILNTIGEVLLGYIGDKPWISTTLLYATFTAVCGAIIALVPLVSNYSSLCIVAGTFGFAISANYSLTSIIIVDLITLEKFTNAYGLLLLVQGVANLIGPPLAGWMCDLTGSYDLSFYMAGLWIFVSGIMMLVLPCLKFCCNVNIKNEDYDGSKKTKDVEDPLKVTMEKHRGRKKNCPAKETCL